ncbi:GNAT family N-acetyltransferase [Roseibacterium sp. SDUM158017]|nr:GNAT family N-acetyltransferase [Roseibacterium sp. SDUM158017]MDG4650364.1 GNAT family N-acetyltransferase [Roseibacterium sp. SDUM158017]
MEALDAVERSAAQAFSAIPGLGWLAHRASPPRHLSDRVPAGDCRLAATGEGCGIVGFILARRVEVHLHIDEISVRRDWQRRGIGQTLMRHVLDAANEQDVVGTTLTTWRDVPWNAPWYRRFGFRVLGAEEAPKFLSDLLALECAEGLSPPERVAMIRPKLPSR